MKTRILATLATGLLAAEVVACSSNSSTAPGADAGGDAKAATVSFTEVITDGATGTPVSGFKLCVSDHPEIPCATSDAKGSVTLAGLPANSELAIEATNAGYVSYLQILTTTQSDLAYSQGLAAFLKSDSAALASWYKAANVTADATKGLLQAFAFPGVPGVTMTLAPTSGVGPIYGKNGSPDPTLTATVGGAGWFFNLAPGTYEVAFTDPTSTCKWLQTGGWKGSTPNAVKVRVVAGFNTTGAVALCASADGGQTYSSTHPAVADAASCIAAAGTAANPTCLACECNKCLTQVNACFAQPGCYDIFTCAVKDGCSGSACYAPSTCQSVIDGTPGGITGAATTSATGAANCTSSQCATECAPPADAGPG